MAFICTTPDEQEDDLKFLGNHLDGMGYEVRYSKDFCHPQGQKVIYDSISEEEKVVLICKRALERQVFEHSLFTDTEFFSYAMEDDPRELASRIHQDIMLRPTRRMQVVGPAPLQRVMVVGGGVAGVYATLDIAQQGYPVYLVERDPSIGGIMAALDKTFPTMDCSI